MGPGQALRAFRDVNSRSLVPEENASTRILRRLGLQLLGPVEDPEDGTVWRWVLPRRPEQAA